MSSSFFGRNMFFRFEGTEPKTRNVNGSSPSNPFSSASSSKDSDAGSNPGPEPGSKSKKKPTSRDDRPRLHKDKDELILHDPSFKMRPGDDFETFRKNDASGAGWANLVEVHYPSVPRGKTERERAIERRERKERFVALRWPRDPKGKFLIPDNSEVGKMTPNGIEHWGATLYDFYITARIPSNLGLRTISTGSKLAAWCKKMGELDWAQEEIRRAEMEEDPHQIHVFDIGQYLEVLEDQVSKGRVGKPEDVDRSDKKVGTKFLCAPSEYPAPWPLKPFSAPLARLQQKFPHSALPRKLIVHDPWNALLTSSNEAKHVDRSECKWGSKEDIIRTYHLKLNSNSNSGESSDSKSESESESASESASKVGDKAKTETKETETEKEDPECPVAHLYISPRRRIGQGNHSFVYQVELELPREMLVRPKACWECLMMQYRVTKAMYEQAIIDNEYKEMFLKTTEDEVKEYFSQINKLGGQFTKEKHDELKDDKFAVLEKTINWQAKPPYCEHLDRGVPIPPSHRVSITAKLCLPRRRAYEEDHEYQLKNEAKLYQEFPSHVFEHWNGYNIIHPLHEPTPVGAVVPQFYGYYVPDKDSKPLKKGSYLSPILLLEHCGVQVDPKKLSLDDRHECFSLIRRLHYAGYTHGSIYQRNFVMQYGPLQESPFKRSKRHLRFRLIDFGRSRALPEVDENKPCLACSYEAKNACENLEIREYNKYEINGLRLGIERDH